MQNFSEDYMRDHVLAGVVALPALDTAESFVDAEDIADVAGAALMDDRHIGELYELTGVGNEHQAKEKGKWERS